MQTYQNSLLHSRVSQNLGKILFGKNIIFSQFNAINQQLNAKKSE